MKGKVPDVIVDLQRALRVCETCGEFDVCQDDRKSAHILVQTHITKHSIETLAAALVDYNIKVVYDPTSRCLKDSETGALQSPRPSNLFKFLITVANFIENFNLCTNSTINVAITHDNILTAAIHVDLSWILQNGGYISDLLTLKFNQALKQALTMYHGGPQ